jgi:hypothetical protein
MHATIQYDALLTRAEIVTISADLGPTRQVDELQNRAPTCQSPACEQSAFFSFSPELSPILKSHAEMIGWRQFHCVASEDSRENRPLGSVAVARLRDFATAG